MENTTPLPESTQPPLQSKGSNKKMVVGFGLAAIVIVIVSYVFMSPSSTYKGMVGKIPDAEEVLLQKNEQESNQNEETDSTQVGLLDRVINNEGNEQSLPEDIGERLEVPNFSGNQNRVAVEDSPLEDGVEANNANSDNGRIDWGALLEDVHCESGKRNREGSCYVPQIGNKFEEAGGNAQNEDERVRKGLVCLRNGEGNDVNENGQCYWRSQAARLKWECENVQKWQWAEGACIDPTIEAEILLELAEGDQEGGLRINQNRLAHGGRAIPGQVVVPGESIVARADAEEPKKLELLDNEIDGDARDGNPAPADVPPADLPAPADVPPVNAVAPNNGGSSGGGTSIYNYYSNINSAEYQATLNRIAQLERQLADSTQAANNAEQEAERKRIEAELADARVAAAAIVPAEEAPTKTKKTKKTTLRGSAEGAMIDSTRTANAEQRNEEASAQAAATTNSARASSLHGASIRGKTGPGLLIPLLVAGANALYIFSRKQKNSRK